MTRSLNATVPQRVIETLRADLAPGAICNVGSARQLKGSHNMAAKYDLLKSSDGQIFFNLKAANGKVILTSERYKCRASAATDPPPITPNVALAIHD
jgi:hypothetical protein